MYPSFIFAAAWPFLSPLFLQLSFTAFWDCGILTYFECYEFSFLDSLIQCVQNLWRIRVRNVPFPYNEILFVLNEIQMLAWWIIRVGRLFVLLSSFSKKNVFFVDVWSEFILLQVRCNFKYNLFCSFYRPITLCKNK